MAQRRRLELNPRYGHVVPSETPSTFLGYRVSRTELSPSRKLRRRFRKRVWRAAKRGDEALVRTLRSYVGLLVDPG